MTMVGVIEKANAERERERQRVEDNANAKLERFAEAKTLEKTTDAAEAALKHSSREGKLKVAEGTMSDREAIKWAAGEARSTLQGTIAWLESQLAKLKKDLDDALSAGDYMTPAGEERIGQAQYALGSEGPGEQIRKALEEYRMQLREVNAEEKNQLGKLDADTAKEREKAAKEREKAAQEERQRVQKQNDEEMRASEAQDDERQRLRREAMTPEQRAEEDQSMARIYTEIAKNFALAGDKAQAEIYGYKATITGRDAAAFFNDRDAKRLGKKRDSLLEELRMYSAPVGVDELARRGGMTGGDAAGAMENERRRQYQKIEEKLGSIDATLKRLSGEVEDGE
jgi:hypothetical protein